MINLLFENLSHRFRNENDLSDITWAMCQTSESFKEDFLKFFFPEIDIKAITEFVREKIAGDSRADFCIKIGGMTYIIECKIGDTNHHFEQYCAAFEIPRERLGYITNYNLSKSGFVTKTWSGLFDCLEKRDLPENSIEKYLYNGYLAYLKNVCSIVKINKLMNINGMYDLYCFSEVLKSVLDRETDGYKLGIGTRDLKDWSAGYNFEVSPAQADLQDIWVWVGVYYDRPEPVIYFKIWNNDAWGKPFFDKIEKNGVGSFNPIYATEPYLEEQCYYYFETSDRFKTEFDDAKEVEEQKEVLQKFIDEVIGFYTH